MSLPRVLADDYRRLLSDKFTKGYYLKDRKRVYEMFHTFLIVHREIRKAYHRG